MEDGTQPLIKNVMNQQIKIDNTLFILTTLLN